MAYYLITEKHIYTGNQASERPFPPAVFAKLWRCFKPKFFQVLDFRRQLPCPPRIIDAGQFAGPMAKGVKNINSTINIPHPGLFPIEKEAAELVYTHALR